MTVEWRSGRLKSDNLKAHRVILPVFTKIEACAPDTKGAKTFEGQDQVNYRFAYETDPITDELRPIQRNLFPVVVDSLGKIWEPALLFIAHRVFAESCGDMRTHHNVAADLAAYKQFLDEKHLAFNSFDVDARYELPTYRYRNALQKEFDAGRLAASTAKRRMQTVVSFYRYLIEHRILSPKNQPWVKKIVTVHLKDEKGFTRSKQVETTDLRIKANKQPDPWSDAIEDGGKLKPLAWDDQIALVTALIKVGNPEMLLIHLLALFSGARIQSILTFRVSHFEKELLQDTSDVQIKIGPGTGVNTKGGKVYSLFVPVWLYKKVLVYSKSERSIRRRAKAGKDTADQYLFLTKSGNPYYTSNEDRNRFIASRTTSTDSNGQEVRKFKRHLIHAVRASGSNSRFYYRFHDLRATFGMNLTDAQLKLVESGSCTLAEVREYVKFRMGHSNYIVTDRYISFRANQKFTRSVRDAYGEHLEQLREIAMNSST